MKIKSIDCREAEGMIDKYISNDIEWKELECFLHHVKYCSSCRDELETQYIVKEALEQLDNSEDNEMDIQKRIKENISKSEKDVKRLKRWSKIGVLVNYIVMSLVLGVLLELVLLLILF